MTVTKSRNRPRMEPRTPENPMPIRKFLKDNARKAVLWALEPEAGTTLPPHRPTPPKTTSKSMSTDLKGKTTLMLKSLLAIHESIEDAEAWQGYEGTPDQLDQIRNEIYGILVMHPEVTTSIEVEEIWMEDYATMHLREDQTMVV
jgi:hypothetical protein